MAAAQSSELVLGTFHSIKTSGLNFRQLPLTNGTAFSKISKNMDNLARNTQIFSRKFSFHSTLPPEFLEFPVEWFAFGNSTAFGISGKFCGKFLYHLPLFLNFRKFCLNEKRPLSSHVKPVLRPMVITEPTVPSARLLGLGSKFLK